jgi:hypothetical protein
MLRESREFSRIQVSCALVSDGRAWVSGQIFGTSSVMNCKRCFLRCQALLEAEVTSRVDQLRLWRQSRSLTRTTVCSLCPFLKLNALAALEDHARANHSE